MGVYIKGMKMPDSCDVCKFSDWSNLHQTACCKILEYEACFNDFSSEYKTRISDLCPLVEVSEPHKKLVEFIDVTIRDDNSKTVETNFGKAFAAYFKMREAKPVIEAEGE